MTAWLQLDQTKPLTFRKESLPTGRIVKGDREWSITAANLSQIASTANEMLADGILIPFAKSHVGWTETENKLGKIVFAAVDKNSDGVDALFLDVAFDSEAARDLALSGEVSVSIPVEWKDGKGKVWINPLVHLASTAAPVVAGMDSWQALAASFNKDTHNMSKLLELLGVDSEDKAVAAITELQARPKVEKEFAHDAFVVRTLADSRQAELGAMVTMGEISPATKAELIASFCTDKQIGLELSQKSKDTYDQTLKLVKLASKSQPVPTHGRSSTPGKNEVELSHNGGGTSGLALVIDQMAKDHASRFRRN